MNRLQLFLLFLFLVGCGSSPSSIAGGSTDTELGQGYVVGIAKKGSIPLADGNVIAVPETFRPGVDPDSLIERGSTDSTGNFRIALFSGIKYNIIIRDSMLENGVFISGSKEKISVIPSEEISVGSFSVQPLSIVQLNTSFSTENQYYIKGTDLVGTSNETGFLEFTDVPTGEMPTVYLYAPSQGTESPLLVDLIVLEMDTTYVPYQHKVLFLYETTEYFSVQANQIYAQLQSLFTVVDTLGRKRINSDIFANYDLVYCDRFVDSLVDSNGISFDSLFAHSELPLIVGSKELLESLLLVTKVNSAPVAIPYSVTIEESEILPVEIFYGNSLMILAGTNNLSCSGISAVEGASALLSYSQISPPILSFTLDAGEQLSDMAIAPARRVTIPETTLDAVFSQDMIRSIRRLALWSAGLL